eukprot:GFUD01070419.1.p1 GENE.GFUD01070419.1~~GFUD01070419.1.p1  ORF type:complete len:202 (+),score=22.18 GFUD01070419.1:35-640(+)
MGNCCTRQKPLACTLAKNKNRRIVCFKDYTFPPQFQDIDCTRLEKKISGPQYEEIKYAFNYLSENINEEIKKEYTLEDRITFNKKMNFIKPFQNILLLALILLILTCMVTSWICGSFFSELFFVIFPVFLLNFLLAFASERLFGIKIMRKRLNTKIESVVISWNVINAHNGVFAVHEPERWEGDKDSRRKIPESLTLWNRE